MSTFLFILACIIWFCTVAGVAGGAMVLAMHLVMEYQEYRKAAGVVACGVVALAVVIWVGIAAGLVTGGDNSRHCGPGTTYRESSSYNPATKTVQTDWVCEANR